MSLSPGPRNLITDVPGLHVGNAEDQNCLTGCTVILPARAATAAVDVRGGGPGTRETDLLSPDGTVNQVDALVLSGGSAFGLDAASGVQSWLAARGRGFDVGGMTVPIVPAAILFDLLNGGDKNWGDMPPYRDLARQACDTAAAAFALGNIGAGLGAQAGPLKGGLGSSSIQDMESGWTIGALAAVNSIGGTVMPGADCFWAWPFELAGELGNQRPPKGPVDPAPDFHNKTGLRQNTTLAVIATDAPLSAVALRRIAIMAQDGLARAIRPVHSPLDGDLVFALTTAESREASDDPFILARIGALAADCLARAIARGVYEAESLGGLPAYRDIHA